MLFISFSLFFCFCFLFCLFLFLFCFVFFCFFVFFGAILDALCTELYAISFTRCFIKGAGEGNPYMLLSV